MRSSRTHVVLANLVDFSLSVFREALQRDDILLTPLHSTPLLTTKRWHLEVTRHNECPTVLPRARIPLVALGQSGHRNSEESSGCAGYEGRRVGRLLSGGTCEPASKEKEEEESRNSFLLVMSGGIREALEM